MRIQTYTSEGIVLARRNYGEADRILVVYSKDSGRLSLIAKGIRRPKSRKRGHLEIFSRIEFQARAGRGLDLMTEVEVVDDFKDLRKSLKKISLAYYICEVVGKITHENEKNEELFNLILSFLNRLKRETQLRNLRLEFLNELLTLMGYWPKGKVLVDPDRQLAETVEKQISSVRVGKRLAI